MKFIDLCRDAESTATENRLFRQMTMVLDRKLRQEVNKAFIFTSSSLIIFFFQIAKLTKPPTISIYSCGGVKADIQNSAFRCLRPTGWLNDEVINGYTQLVYMATKAKGVIVLNSFVMTKLLEGYNFVKRVLHKASWTYLYDFKAVDFLTDVGEGRLRLPTNIQGYHSNITAFGSPSEWFRDPLDACGHRLPLEEGHIHQ